MTAHYLPETSFFCQVSTIMYIIYNYYRYNKSNLQIYNKLVLHSPAVHQMSGHPHLGKEPCVPYVTGMSEHPNLRKETCMSYITGMSAHPHLGKKPYMSYIMGISAHRHFREKNLCHTSQGMLAHPHFREQTMYYTSSVCQHIHTSGEKKKHIHT